MTRISVPNFSRQPDSFRVILSLGGQPTLSQLYNLSGLRYLSRLISMNISATKLLRHVDRLARWAITDEVVPINVQICPYDSACNHACPLCVAGTKGFTGSIMSPTAYEGLVRDLALMGVRSITLTGGSEPLLHPDFDDLLSVDIGPMQQAIITNGSFINDRRARALVTKTEWVRVSLDAATSSHFRKMHGCGPTAFELVLQNLALVVDAKRKLISEAYAGPLATVGAGFLTYPCESSLEEIVPFAQLCRDLGLDYVQYRPVLKTPQGPELPWSDLKSHEAVYEAIQRASQLESSSFKVSFNADKYERTTRHDFSGYTQCHFVHFAPVVSASGNVSLCCHHMEDDAFVIGNINDQSFSEIWFSEAKRAKTKHLDLGSCPLLCRGTGANELLQAVRIRTVHENFI